MEKIKVFKVTFSRHYEIPVEDVESKLTKEDLELPDYALTQIREEYAQEIAMGYLEEEMGFFDTKDFVSATVELININK